ncbi:MAG: AAA family ATPase [Deltaproteobacteria bacterium]|nr:AAA family ATPase [Deltaproteobacteria bacterium]
MAARADLPHGSRRVATVLFADLSGYSRLAEQLDPEELAALMNRILVGATRIVEAHGGIVNQFSGDDVKALFGVPAAHDDDPRRAVAAALELHQFVGSLARPGGQPLTLHTAIATGVIVTQVRDQREGLFGVTGDTINTAARLVGAAKADEIVIDAATKRAVAPFFETAALGDLPLRGKQRPVQAHRVLRAIPRSWFEVPRERGLSPYAGRADEHAALARCLDSARRGRGSLVAVEGQPGVGKSRLLYELRARAGTDVRVALAGCEGAAIREPFHPFLRLLRELLDVRDAVAPEMQRSRLVAAAARLGPTVAAAVPLYLQLLSLRTDEFPIPAHLQEDQLRAAILASLSALLVAAAHQQPLLVLLEDWHWADESSTDALRHLARVVAGHAMVVLVTYRPEGERPWREPQPQFLRLQPLATDDARLVIAARLGQANPPDELVRRLCDRTGGNPLFLEEVCQSLVEHAVTASAGLDGAIAALDIPPTVEAVIRARVDRLPEADRALLTLAAVLGRVFPLRLLETLAEQRRDAVAATLARLAEHELVAALPDDECDEPTFQFKHAITREVVYDLLLRQHRRALHRRAGEAIEALTPPDRLAAQYEALAAHYEQGEAIERAAHFAARAADKAAASFSLVAARTQYRHAIALLDQLDGDAEQQRRRIDLSAQWAAASVYDPAAARCDVLHTSYELAERLGYRRGAARAVYWMGWFEHAFGNHETAIAHFERALELADPLTDYRLVSQLHTNLGQSYYHGAEFALASDHLSRAIALRGGGAASKRTVVIANARGYLALIDAERGDFAAARVQVDEALGIVRQLGQRQIEGSILTMAAYVALFHGDWDDSLAIAAEMRAIADAVGAPYIDAMSRTASGFARVVGRGDAGGIDDLERAVQALEASGSQLSMSVNYGCLAEALVRLGEPARAIPFAERALARSQASDRIGEIQAHRALALAWAHGTPPRGAAAVERLQSAIRLADSRGALREAALTRLALAELAGPQTSIGGEALAQAIDAFTRFDMGWHLAHARQL